MNGTGTAKINISKMKAGERGVFTIVYETGSYGIDDSGEIIIARRDVCDSDIPQFDSPVKPGFVSVTTDAEATLSVSYLPTRHVRPWKACISIRVSDGSLYPGDRVYVKFGDENGPGYRIQTFPEERHIFKVLADCMGSGDFYEVGKSPEIRITGGEIASIEACGPSYARPFEPFGLLVRALDMHGNIADGYYGDAEIVLSGRTHRVNLIKGTALAKDVSISAEGVFTPIVKTIDGGFSGSGNPVVCTIDPPSLFWGDMHGQTGETVGTGTPELYFSFARDKAFLDFSGWQGNDFQVTDETWAGICKITREYNEPGKFVCFPGYEWSGTTPTGGDHNIYFLNDDEEIHRSSRWQTGMVDVNGSDRNPISRLWDEFDGREDAMAIPHVGGRHANLAFYNPALSPVLEIHSHHGSFEWFFREALARGQKPGIIAASDDHSCRPGLSFPTDVSSRGGFVSFDVKGGYTAVFAPELTRQSIWSAIKARHCYGTSGERIIASVHCGEYMMGDEFTTGAPPVIEVSIIGTAPIRELFVMRNLTEAFSLNDHRPRNMERIFIEWSGVRVRSRSKKALWDGTVSVVHGSITGVAEYQNGRRGKRAGLVSGSLVKFSSATSGDTDGFELDMIKTSETLIKFKSNHVEFGFMVPELADGDIIRDAGGVNLAVRAGHPPQNPQKSVDLRFIDTTIEHGLNAYWVKAVQEDGHAVWTSPMYIHYEK
ncbi:MAG: DUF3604 domain-containing protein [Clostridia bacterium]